MGFDDVLKKYFDKVYTEIDFVKKTYASLKGLGFSDDNTIAATCICRDEISQTLRSIIKHMWGEAFNLSSLAGMFFAGKTGLSAAMHHAPVADNKERYVFYALPHIAIAADGKLGVCKREGREGSSTACGALAAFQKEMSGGKLNLLMDNEDVEQSLIRMRLLREIQYGKVPDLLELTKITQAAIQADLENTLKAIIPLNPPLEKGGKGGFERDYAIITGIQIHGPEGNYVWPASCYAIVNGNKIQLKVE